MASTEELVRIKQDQIAALKKEISMLKGESIGRVLAGEKVYQLVTAKKGIRYTDNPAWISAWNSIASICVCVHELKHPMPVRQTLKQKDLTKEELALSADMAKEILSIWNKYVEITYNFTLQDMVPEYGHNGGDPFYKYE